MMIAEVLTSTAAVIISVAILVMSIRGFKRIEANVGQVKVFAEQIDKAVNQVGPNEPPLRQLVASIYLQLDGHVTETNERLTKIEAEITRLRPTLRKKAT